MNLSKTAKPVSRGTLGETWTASVDLPLKGKEPHWTMKANKNGKLTRKEGKGTKDGSPRTDGKLAKKTQAQPTSEEHALRRHAKGIEVMDKQAGKKENQDPPVYNEPTVVAAMGDVCPVQLAEESVVFYKSRS